MRATRVWSRERAAHPVRGRHLTTLRPVGATPPPTTPLPQVMTILLRTTTAQRLHPLLATGWATRRPLPRRLPLTQSM